MRFVFLLILILSSWHSRGQQVSAPEDHVRKLLAEAAWNAEDRSDSALYHVHEAYLLARETRDPMLCAEAALSLSKVVLRAGLCEHAVRYAQESLQWQTSHPDRMLRIEARCTMADGLACLGLHDQASVVYLQSLETEVELASSPRLQALHLHAAEAMARMDIDNAWITEFNRAISTNSRSAGPQSLAFGRSYMRLGQNDSAAVQFQLAQQWARMVNDTTLLFNSMIHLARIDLLSKRVKPAGMRIDSLEQLAGATGSAVDPLRVMMLRVRLASHNKKWKDAKQLAELVRVSAEEKGDTDMLIESLDILLSIANASKDKRAALMLESELKVIRDGQMLNAQTMRAESLAILGTLTGALPDLNDEESEDEGFLSRLTKEELALICASVIVLALLGWTMYLVSAGKRRRQRLLSRSQDADHQRTNEETSTEIHKQLEELRSLKDENRHLWNALRGVSKQRMRMKTALSEDVSQVQSVLRSALDNLVKESGNQLPVDRVLAFKNAVTRSTGDLKQRVRITATDFAEGDTLPRQLRALAEESHSAECSVEFHQDGDWSGLGWNNEWFLFQIASELTMNAVSHSLGKQVDVVLSADAGKVLLEVSDNGKGITTEEASRGEGLKYVRTLAQYLNARVDVETAPEKGTRFLVSLYV